MLDVFFTIEEEIEEELIEKKSRFIARVMRVNTEEEANTKIAKIKKDNRDARHNVFAYRIANGEERFSDDGEPNGTAGVPILSILRGEKIENVLVVVTRYFGGILLGTGGLVRAYSSVAKDAILKAKKVEMKLCVEYELLVDYSLNDILNHYFKNHEIVVKNVEYNEKICMTVIFEKTLENEFIKEINDITNRNITYKVKDSYYYS